MAAQLQATFLPDPAEPRNGAMAWWGDVDHVDTARRLELPEGAPGRTALAIPENGTVTARTTAVRIVPLTQAVPALAALTHRERVSDSMRAWRSAATMTLSGADPDELSALAATMPPAAYAAADDGTVWEPAALLSQFVAAVSRTYLSTTTVAAELDRAKGAATGPAAVEATLRPYQRNGLAWLHAVARHDVGGILADDMGLGKTLQAIALMAERRTDRPHLVVCPTSVVGNWVRELRRFAPDLDVTRHHGPGRSATGDFAAGAVVITSYQVMLRDLEQLSAVAFDVVVLDEAQQIKNRGSATAKAARKLPADVRLALTGTPVENRLSELWSIMDFANPGLLGPYNRFQKKYAEPIETRHDARVTARLRDTVSPYLLRRLKADVATDLPAKQESIVACTLTAEQAKLYRSAVSQALDEGFGSGIARHGRVLRLLTRLKQICNHPAQFLGQDGPITGRSGKLARATEMLAEAVDEGTQSLVFTQYRVMGELLTAHFAERLDLPDVPFLHGGVSQPARDAMVEHFQTAGSEAPILVVSLKAGGTGLNLTAATHVLHYDRWWNPAVEDQATDRAHRIGQTRPVDVYKLVTGGTLEERIADMLERKRRLADTIVGTGEEWITELDDGRLRKLVELSELEVGE